MEVACDVGIKSLGVHSSLGARFPGCTLITIVYWSDQGRTIKL